MTRSSHAKHSGALAVIILLATQRTGGILASADKPDVDRTGKTHGCDRACQKECISTLNKYRENHGSPSLVFNQRLADQAQALIDRGLFKHSDWIDGKEREAFAWGSVFPSFTAAIKSWHDEGAHFDYDSGKASDPTQNVRHFAQLVWKKTRMVGCARGVLYGEPWYVVHYDNYPTLTSAHSKEYIGRPKQDDNHWFRDGSPFSLELESPQQI